MSYSAFFLGLAQLIFIFNFFWSIAAGEKSGTAIHGRPPPSSGRHPRRPRMGTSLRAGGYRGPYEYSLPGATDFFPQHEPGPETASPIPGNPQPQHA